MTLSVSLPVIGLIAFTVIAFFIAARKAPEAGDYGAGAVIGCLFYMFAAVAVLAAWLIWALVR